MADGNGGGGAPARRPELAPGRVLAALALIAALAAAAAFGVYRGQRAEVLREKHNELAAIAHLKADEIAFWRWERIADARALAHNPLLADEMQAFARNPRDEGVRARMFAFLESLRVNSAYEAAAVLGERGGVLLAAGLDPGAFEAHVSEHFREEMRGDDVTLTDLHPGASEGTSHMGCFIPVLIPAGPAEPRLFLYLQIQPAVYLFPLVQTWPTPSPSGETLLVRREGDEVVFLNELRHRSGTSLRLRLPVSRVDLPAAALLRGVEGPFEGRDYRDVPVIAHLRRIADSPWALVAKVDRAEVLAAIEERGKAIAALGALSFLFLGAVVVIAWRQSRLEETRRRLADSERHRAELEDAFGRLRASEERYRRTLDDMLEGAQILDSELRCLYVNEAAARHGRTTVGALLGRSLLEVYPGMEGSAFVEELRRCLRERTPRRFENEIRFRDGSVGWFELSVQPAPEGVFVLSIDVTERKRAEEQLARTVAELRRSNEELQQFAYIASHDLQEPLRMIASFLQLIERRYGDRLDAEGREFIGFAVGGAERLQGMIEGLLAYSRLERAPRGKGSADAERALAKALENLRVAIAESGAVVTHDPLPRLRVDEEQLVQVFQNLLGNAIKFRGAEAPRIHVSSEAGPGGPTIAVCDNGIGVPPQHAERVFRIFRRLHGQGYPGSGIGLTLCRRIVERHGGRIWVDGGPAGGAKFCFTLPEGESA